MIPDAAATLDQLADIVAGFVAFGDATGVGINVFGRVNTVPACVVGRRGFESRAHGPRPHQPFASSRPELHAPSGLHPPVQ